MVSSLSPTLNRNYGCYGFFLQLPGRGVESLTNSSRVPAALY